jgi:hypothetical protein
LTKKQKNGNPHGTLKVIQRAVTIVKFDWTIPGGCRSFTKQQPWRRAIIELSIKEPLFGYRLSVFL